MTESLPGRPVSLWLDGPERARRPALDHDLSVDVAIVGAGIVGLSTALELSREGARVAVLEARGIGSGVSGNTTAKLSSLQGLRYASLVSRHGPDVAGTYAAANERGIARVAELVAELGIDCDLRRKPNFTYTEDARRVAEIEAEVEAARAAGLAAVPASETDLPFTVEAAIRLDDQAEFHPVDYLRGLADAVEAGGSRVYEDTRAVKAGGGRVVVAGGAMVSAERIVIATQIPFLDRGLFFARMRVQSSYAISARLAGQVPQGMYLQAESPGRSLRAHPWEGGELLIVGGESHERGHGDAADRFAALERYARRRFDVAGFEHRWSAHDFIPDDGLPYIGRLWPPSDRILTVTGLQKWGLAMGVAAAAILADEVAGREHQWAAVFDPGRMPSLSAAPKLLKHNAESGLHFVADRLRRGGSVADLAPGDGRVIGDGLGQKAVHRDDDGVLHAVSARCTHLGCIVHWNRAEGTWDCPCHGSRFEAGGAVANGPATQPLEPKRPPTEDISSGRRGGKRSGSSSARGRTREQLYNEAAKLNIRGRSKMNKKQLLAAINRKKGS